MVEKKRGESKEALLVAKYFVWKSTQDPKPTGLDKLKLQKLLYYAQAWNLVINKDRLFTDKIEAWVRGPVVPEVWRYFKDVEFDSLPTEDMTKASQSFSSDEKKILDEVWRIYGKYDGPYLETLTHSELPWQEARKDTPEFAASNHEISLRTMEDYFTRRYKDALATGMEGTKE